MRKVFLAIGLGVATLIVFTTLRDHTKGEPRYNGVPLSSFMLLTFRTGVDDLNITTSRLSIIDTNALPFLIQWLKYQPQPWRAKLANLILTVSHNRLSVGLANRVYHSKGEDLAECSVLAFIALGPKATPAISALKLIMNDPSHGDACPRATAALGAIGTNALPALLEAIRNSHHHYRFEAFYAALETTRRDGTVISLTLSNELNQFQLELDPDHQIPGTSPPDADAIDLNTGHPVTLSTKPTSAAFHLSTPPAPSPAASK
jgi:hypothetical protein